MGKHLEWLTVELERASEKIPLACPLSEVIEEARCHIVSSQEALMELGLSEQMAEEEAVKRFGNAREYVRSLAPLYQPKAHAFDIQTLVILLAATIFTVFFICHQDGQSIEMWIGWGIFATLAVRRMWIVRRVQWSVAMLFIPASILLGIAYPLCWMNPRHEVLGHLNAAMAPEYQSFLTTMVGQYDRAEAELQQSLKEPFGLVAPAWLQYSQDQVIVRSTKYANMAEAAELRATVVPGLIKEVQERREFTAGQLAEVNEALATPLWQRLLQDFKIGPFFGLGWTVLLLGLNLVVAALRAIYDRARRILKLA